MPEPKKHDTRSKVGKRRSQKNLKPIALLTCKSCNAPKLPHRICSNCGEYGNKKSR